MKNFLLISLLLLQLGYAQSFDNAMIPISREVLLNNKNNSKFSLVYTMAYWCKPCIENFDAINRFIKTNSELLTFYLTFNEDKSNEITRSLNFMKDKFNWQEKIYSIDLSYGNRFKKRYKNFVQDVVPNHKEYGLSLFILLNDKGEVIYASTYNETTPKILTKLNNMIHSN